MKPKILMIYTEWAADDTRKENNYYGGCGYYRIVKPAEHLKEWYDIDVIGREITTDFGKTGEEVWTTIFNKYEMVYSRHTDNPTAGSDLLFMSEYKGKPVMIDFDDNYVEVRESSPAYEHYHPGSWKQTVTNTITKMVDAVTVSTDPLKMEYEKRNKNINVLPNCNDINDWKFPVKKSPKGKIRIGWAGSMTHDEDLEMVAPAIKRILEKYKNVEFVVLGGLRPEKLKWFYEKFEGVRERIDVIAGKNFFKAYPPLLAEQGFDIGICPLTDNDFTICKSHIKWMEYSMYKIPTVASKVYPYYKDIQGTKTIEHGKTGLLATTEDEWFQELEKLVLSEDLRNELGNNAYNYIKDNWQWKHHIHKWKKVIDQYLFSKQPKTIEQIMGDK